MSKKDFLRSAKYCLRFMPDKAYLNLYYFLHFKKFMNLKNPKTYNEKLKYLKLHDKNPNYTNLVDKYEYMEDKTLGELRDYKFFCFEGTPKWMFIATGRAKNQTTFDYYDLDFNHLNIRQHYPNSPQKITRPAHFAEMIELSKILSKNLPHARIDFYEVNNQVYFGEITFYHFSGLQPFNDDAIDYEWGTAIDLTKLRGQK